MKKIIKTLLKTILVLIVCFLVFYFWASSKTLDKKEYSKLIENNYSLKLSNDSIYSIVTYNIGYLSGMTNNIATEKSEENKQLYETNLEKVKLEIIKLNPDILAFQEIDYDASRSYTVDQEEEIAKLGYNYVAKAVNWDKRYIPFPYGLPSVNFGKVISGQSIVSKYKLKEYQRIVLDRVDDIPFYKDAFYLDRLLQVTKVEIEGKEIVLMNVHLEAFDKPTRTKQFNYVFALFKKYKNEFPTILLGDFNSEARNTEAVVQEIFKMNDVGNACYDKENPANTYDSKNPKKRIDYIFYTNKTIEYIDGAVLNQFSVISDHLPLEMKFRLK